MRGCFKVIPATGTAFPLHFAIVDQPKLPEGQPPFKGVRKDSFVDGGIAVLHYRKICGNGDIFPATFVAEFVMVWILVIAFLWYHLACSFVLSISFKLVIGSRSLVKYSFDILYLYLFHLRMGWQDVPRRSGTLYTAFLA